jgi:hypothetical protein
MSKSIQWVLMLAGVAGALSNARSLNAQTCTNQSLKGNFGYTVTGSIVTGQGPLHPGPFVAVGRITFDGAGGVKTVRSLSDNGFILQHDAGSGTYSMNSDCTGFFTISVGAPGNEITLSLDIVLDDLYELRGVVTTSGIVLAFEGRKQFEVKY